MTPTTDRSVRLALYFSASLTVMAAAGLAPALPAMEGAFADEKNLTIQLSLLITLPALTTALTAPFCGWVADRAGRGYTLIAALWLYALSGSSGVLLDHLCQILVSRAILGFSVALIMTSAMGLVADYFEGDRRNDVLGKQAAWTAVGGIAFPILGGILAQAHWRAAFLPFIVAAVIALYTTAALRHPPPRRAFTKPQRNQVFSLRLVLLPYSIALVGMMLFNVVPIKIGLFFAEHPGLLPPLSGASFAAGLVIGLLSFFAALSSSSYRHVHRRLGLGGSAAAFFLLFGIGMFIMGMAESFPTMVVGVLIAGLGLGLLMPNVTVWVVGAAPIHSRGLLLGGLTTAIFGGQFLAQFIADPIHLMLGLTSLFVITGFLALSVSLLLVAKNLREEIQGKVPNNSTAPR